jgi:hypothetical protein
MIAAAAAARVRRGCAPSVEIHTSLAIDEPRQQIA